MIPLLTKHKLYDCAAVKGKPYTTLPSRSVVASLQGITFQNTVN